MEKKPIVVLGVEITKGRFPNLYPIAENNPEGFPKQIQALMKTVGQDDPYSAMAMLELDLEHERLCSGAEPRKYNYGG